MNSKMIYASFDEQTKKCLLGLQPSCNGLLKAISSKTSLL